MNVSDIMIRQIDHLRPSDQIGRAALGIISGNLHSIPVCEGKKVIGIVTRYRIFQDIFALKKEKSSDKDHESENQINRFLSLPVKKIMIKLPAIVNLDTSLIKVHTIMDQEDFETLPVVDGDKKLLGIISKIDVFRALIGQKSLFSQSDNYRDFLTGSHYESIDWNNRFKSEMPDLLNLFKKHKVKTVLDVGCGTGQFAIELANQGFSVIGVDLNSKMIDEANRNKKILRRKSLGDVSFWNKEAIDFLYEFDLTFDAILFMSNSVSYNPNTIRHVIKRAANCLSNDGIIVLQITNFNKAIEAKKKLVKFSIINPSDDAEREYAFIEFLDEPIMNKTVLRNLITLVSENGNWKWSGARNTLMAYTDEFRIISILKNEGFRKIETFGGSFDGKHWDYLFRKPFNELESDWLNVIASNKKD